MVKLNRPKLSGRMQTFIDLALDGMPFWDVCCDHGYVGIGAMYTKRFSHIHFVDQVSHIMERLEKLIIQSPSFQDDFKYSLHISSGEKIGILVEGNLLIAGVGGLTIKNILQALLKDHKLKSKRLLLSPHTDEVVLANYLMEDDFKSIYRIHEKIMVTDNQRQRPLYVLDLI